MTQQCLTKQLVVSILWFFVLDMCSGREAAVKFNFDAAKSTDMRNKAMVEVWTFVKVLVDESLKQDKAYIVHEITHCYLINHHSQSL